MRITHYVPRFLLLLLLQFQVAFQEVMFTYGSLLNQYIQSYDVSDWSPYSIINCPNNNYIGLESFLGIFGNNEQPTLIVDKLVPHWSLAVRFDILLFSSLDIDKDYVAVVIDDTQYGQFTKNYSDGVTICSNSSDGFYDDLVLFHQNITSHTSDSVKISILSKTDESITSEGAGLRNLMVHIDRCDITCASCYGPEYNNCLTCPANATKIGNTCSCNKDYFTSWYQCVTSCPAYNVISKSVNNLCIQDLCFYHCSTCDEQNQICLQCTIGSGYYLYKGECIHQCPSSSYISGQKCVDYSEALVNPGYLIENGLDGYFFGESQIKAYGISVSGFYGNRGILSTSAMTAQCGTSYHLLGGPFLAGAGSIIQMPYSNLRPHWSVRLHFMLVLVDSWGITDLNLLVDSVSHSFYTDQVSLSNICGGPGLDLVEYVSSNFTHIGLNMILELSTKQTLSNKNQSFGIKDIFILVDYCTSKCATCKASGCLTCQSGFYVSSKVCIPCDASCASCSGGSSTECTACTGSLFLNTNTSTCVSICPDGTYGNTTTNVCTLCNGDCSTCFAGSNAACLTCSNSSYFFFQNRCLLTCPNGYSNNIASLTCTACPDFSAAGCQSCFPTCETCSPFTISINSATCSLCFPSREKSSGQCICKDTEDQRATFYECSYLSQAVVDILLSKSTPTMKINFGKALSNLIGFPSNSYAICQQIFTTVSLILLGENSSCNISGTFIDVTLDPTSQIYKGDILTFLPGVLKFSNNSPGTIDTFLNNVVSQEALVTAPVVDYTYSAVSDSCVDYSIVFKYMTGDSSRGFKTVTWSLLNQDSSSSVDTAIVSILNAANTQQLINLTIPMGTIPLETTKQIKLTYGLKNTNTGSNIFTFKISKMVSFTQSISDNFSFPMYRFNNLDVVVFFFLKSCDMYGIKTILKENVDIMITSPQASSISFSSANYNSSSYSFNIPPYSLQAATNYNFNIHLQQTSNSLMTSDEVLSIPIQLSPLIVLINGGNRYQNYKTELIIRDTVRDLDIQSATDNQLITGTWTCVSPIDGSPCQNKNGVVLSFSPGSQITIPKRSFLPYISIKLTHTGTKDIRSTSSSIYVSFQEFDLPALTATVTAIDPFSKILNLDEEVRVKLDYDSSVNTDILSYSGTVTYNDETVGIITFDYVSLRFRLWDINSSFDRTILPLEIRFSVYNPNYFMPSISILYFTINFPPNNCIFTYTKDTASMVALKTIFTLSMTGCQDADSPIRYQFFYYSSQSEFDQEVQLPQIVKRKQISDIQKSSLISTVLPTGTVIVLAMAIDSREAIFNTTLAIPVADASLSESDYSQLITQYLSTNGQSETEYISRLSILSQDLSQKKPFKSAAINTQKKQIISSLKSILSLLPLSSSFPSTVDRATQSIIASGIDYSKLEQESVLISMNSSLSSTLPTSFSKIQREIKKQQLTDFFQISNSMTINSNLNATASLSSLQLGVAQTIADKLNENSLPNEGQFQFDQGGISLKTQVITDKNICAYYKCSESDYFNSNDASTQASVYSVQLQSFKTNPFYQDSSFQNYTDTLKEYTNDTLTSYPIIIPLMKSSGVEVNISKPLNLEYAPNNRRHLTTSNTGKTANLTCISKASQTWTISNCQQFYFAKQKLFSCVCNDSHPTTIVDNLENLILNKNLKTAFSGQGFANISNWQNFYCYVAFWLLLFKTIAFIRLLIYGRKLDRLEANIFSPKLSSAKISPAPLNIPKRKASSEADNKQLKLQQNINLSDNDSFEQNIDEADKKTVFSERIKSKQTTMIIHKLQNLPIPYNASAKKRHPSLSPNRQPDEISKTSEQTIMLNSETQKKYNDPTPILKRSSNSSLSLQSSDEKRKDELKKEEEAQINRQNLEKFQNMTKIRQILYFHNFFNIFLLPDEKQSRPFRFTIFYVRMIHSLAVGIVYSAQYNQLEMIVLSIVNSIIIAIVLKLLEILSKLKRVGKMISSLFLIIILVFYYYLILSIVSGQEYSESNATMTSYLIVFFTDLFFISVVISYGLRILAMYVLKYWERLKYWRQIFDFLKLQLIFSTVINK